MSGIAGIFHRDRAPVERGLIEAMTGCLAGRGPDARETRIDGPVALGRTWLRTTPESARERQPCTLDGEVWIAADARLDGRSDSDRDATDPELILRAYEQWGEACVEHLLGDFAFILWDGRRRVWFCARDPFGVKPFYYAEAGRALVCGNTLSCLRLHPGISGRLNDLTVADFLLFGVSQSPDATYFAGIHRLPAGHCLVCSEAALLVRRYWSLPVREVRYRKAGDYVERFHELFRQAVNDRTRADRVAVFMSGGADSTLVAAVARAPGLRAFTTVFDRIIPDQERKFAQLTADFLSIPIEYLAGDDYLPFAHMPEPGVQPESDPLAELRMEQFRRAAGYSRIVLTGVGGDPALETNESYIVDYLRLPALGKLLAGVARSARLSRRVPRLGLRRVVREKLGGKSARFRPLYPAWLDRDLEQRLGLAERWRSIVDAPAPTAHERAAAHRSLAAPEWQSFFECLDPGYTGIALEQRHPFFDVRVAEYLAGLPPLPWCQEKNILKAAGRGILPDRVRLRAKAPLAGDPVWEHLRGRGAEWWDERLQPAPDLARYVDVGSLRRAAENPRQLWMDLRVVSLNAWLWVGRNAW